MTDKENRKMSINAILTNILRVFIIILAIVLCIEKRLQKYGDFSSYNGINIL